MTQTVHQIAYSTAFAIAILFSTWSQSAFAIKPPSAKELLESADRARGSTAVASGLTWTVQVESQNDGNKSSITYDLKVKGLNALAEATEPARNKGETMLFNDRSIWYFRPSLKKPVSISPRQKLMGQAANGDIASTNYARDYDATIVGEELVDGAKTWKLDLKSKDKQTTYDRVTYWISQKERLGVKAEFLAVSGKPFKGATFEYKNKMNSDGKSYDFVSKMHITDANDPNNVTVLLYSKPETKTLSDSIFNINNLTR